MASCRETQTGHSSTAIWFTYKDHKQDANLHIYLNEAMLYLDIHSCSHAELSYAQASDYNPYNPRRLA